MMAVDYVTDFDSGPIARSIWVLSSSLSVGLFMVINKTRGLEITTTVYVSVFIFLLLIASGLAGRPLSRRHRQHEQQKRDMRTQKIFELLR
jgi:hypothetical protein